MTIAGDSAQAIAALATLLLSVVTAGLAAAALSARALFVAGVYASLAAGAASVALLVNGAVLAAIALALAGGALLLVWVLGGMLLSTNSVKAPRRGLPLLSLSVIVAAAGLIAAAAPEMGATSAVAIGEPLGLPLLLTALMAVIGIAVIALIGYGERGVLQKRGRDGP